MAVTVAAGVSKVKVLAKPEAFGISSVVFAKVTTAPVVDDPGVRPVAPMRQTI